MKRSQKTYQLICESNIGNVESYMHQIETNRLRVLELQHELDAVNTALRAFPGYLEDLQSVLKALFAQTNSNVEISEALFEGKTLDELLDALALIQETLDRADTLRHHPIQRLLGAVQRAADGLVANFPVEVDIRAKLDEQEADAFNRLFDSFHRHLIVLDGGMDDRVFYGAYQNQLAPSQDYAYCAILLRDIIRHIQATQRQLDQGEPSTDSSGAGSSSSQGSTPRSERRTSITPDHLPLMPSAITQSSTTMAVYSTRSFLTFNDSQAQ